VVCKVFIRSGDGIEASRRRVDGSSTGKVRGVFVGLQVAWCLREGGKGRGKHKDRRNSREQAFHIFFDSLGEVL
jgi:hypothetical protein